MAKKKNFEVTTDLPTPEALAKSRLSLFDPVSNDKELFNMIDAEQIALGGSPLYYFKVRFLEDHDDVYEEARNKVYTSEPIIVDCQYEPKAVEQTLNQFGLTHEDDQLFTFNKSYIEQMLGRTPQSGDVVMPAFMKIKYQIFEVQEDSFEIYGVYHLVCSAHILRDSDDVQDTDRPSTSDDASRRVQD